MESRWRILELIALYVGVPLALVALRLTVATFPVIPVLWVVAVPVAAWLVTGAGLTRKDVFGLLRRQDVRELPAILLRAAAAAVLLILLLRQLHPDWLFAFLRKNPGFWAIVMVAYPVLSVFPQGLIYRAFFHHRYGGLFPNGRLRLLVAAACFSFSHVFFLNPWALLLTFVGGILFFRTYERTGSPFLANLEHALYGDLVFTIGYGYFLYHGTIALLD